jgi:VanZ family protein
LNRLPLLRIGSWIAVLGWAATIVYLSSLSGDQIEEIAPNLADKVAHFSAFLVGGVLLAVALRLSTAWTWLRIVVVTVLALSAFGAADEYHQLHTPNRSGADLGDWIADALGSIAGAVATSLVYARFARKAAPAPAAD